MLFKFCEGERTIGHGEIIEVTNSELQKSRSHIPVKLANFFSMELEFNKINKGLYETVVDGKSVKLIMNDFPDFPMWTLWYDSKSMDFDDEPKYWKINYGATTSKG